MSSSTLYCSNESYNTNSYYSCPNPNLIISKRSKLTETTFTPILIYTESPPPTHKLSTPHFRAHIDNYRQQLQVLNNDSSNLDDDNNDNEHQNSNNSGMKLVHLLISCAEAVACRDRTQASMLLTELKSTALALATSFQRVASCFVQGLADRLAVVQPLGAVGLVTALKKDGTDFEDDEKKEEALTLAYEICPYIQFGHFVANAVILEAFEGENMVHVVDLGMTSALAHGHQWQKLLDSLVNRAAGPPSRVRITGVSPHSDQLRRIGSDLENYAISLGIDFQFIAISANLESLKPKDFSIEEGEVVAISSVLQLHCVVKESRGALNSVLRVIYGLSPKVLAIVEQDSGHNGPFFLGRFMEALHYYSAVFDALDAMLPRYDTRRAKVEQFYFGEEIRNIVSCEGPARVERHERVDQWRRRMSRAGFQLWPMKMAGPAKEWVEEFSECKGFTVGEEKGCMVLGWKSKPLIAASCWKC